MLYTLRIKLTTPFLGNKQTKKQIREFRRDSNGNIQIDSPQWHFVIREAIDTLGMNVNPEAIRLPLAYRSPRVGLYTRRWKDDRGMQTEEFECIQKGTELTIELLSLKQSENSIQPGPTRDELFHILDCAGKWIGLSPWGSKFTYGRFEVLTLEPNVTDIRRGSSDGDAAASGD